MIQANHFPKTEQNAATTTEEPITTESTNSFVKVEYENLVRDPASNPITELPKPSNENGGDDTGFLTVRLMPKGRSSRYGFILHFCSKND